MGIFVLNGVGNKDGDQSVPEEVVKAEEPVATPAVDTTVNGLPGEGKDDAAEKTIMLNGPLSHIYTQALNAVFSKESTGMGAHLFKYRILNDKDKDEDEIDDTFVYCVDSDSLSSSELIASSEALRDAVKSGKHRKVVLAMESNGVANSRMQLLDEVSRSMGVKVFLSRGSALEHLLEKG